MFLGTIHKYVKQLLENKFDFGNHKVFDENQEVAYLMRVGWGLGFDRTATQKVAWNS
jgi:DNA helicase-2/ATP-dependent DNA helicase PcrA